ncbi:MAG: DUF4294 domain-containing protein [Muribaculaceae bacterium]|nr:DUF4294 domain-containing protein [Muribaculaceae bacterium]
MKRIICLLTTMVVSLFALQASAQVAIDQLELPSPLQKVYAGYYHFVEAASGDTLMMLVMNTITIYPKERFRNKAEEEFYWKTVRDIKRTLPYAKLICSTLLETYEYIDTYQNEKQKQAYLEQFEKEIFKEYKPVMKKMTKNQGKMLIKLINRETNQSSFNIVKAFLGTFRAGFWQTFGRFFGVSLKQGFHPNKNKEDALIERICVRIEQGTL